MHAFFQHTRRTVTLEDIQNHALNDPGYPRYVHALNSIRESGHIPSKASFHLSEPIELAGFGDSNSVRDPEGFRRFRRFTTAIALVLVAQGWDDHAPNYIVHRLLLDSPAGDSEYMNLARGALNELVTVLKPAHDVFGVSNEYPFLILGEMILSLWLGEADAANRCALSVIEEEEAVWMDEDRRLPGRKDGHFLFCLTWFDQFEAEWKRLLSEVPNPLADPDVARVLELCAGGPR